MRPQLFQIQIQSPYRKQFMYFPGEVIHCILHVDVGDNQRCFSKGIKVTFEGKAAVHWTEEESASTGHYEYNRTIVHEEEETYFESAKYLVGTGEVGSMISPGRYEYPFEFTLPLGIPSSFENAYGKVFYQVHAEIVQGLMTPNHRAMIPFTVNGIVDLNLRPSTGEQKTESAYKDLCCFCCRSGPVGFTLTIPRCGYVPGEILSFNGDFSNQSRKRVDSLSACLIQKSIFHANGESKSTEKILCTAVGPAVEVGDSEVWVGNIFQIPHLPPTHLGGSCSVIDVQYFLKIEVHLAGVGNNLQHEIPLIIGSIPIGSTFQEFVALHPIDQVDVKESSSNESPVDNGTSNPAQEPLVDLN